MAHIAFSLGDGRTVEAANQVLDACVRTAYNRGCTAAATIPGIGVAVGSRVARQRLPRSPHTTCPTCRTAPTVPRWSQMQQMLIALGVSGELAAAGATGRFRDKTERAVRAFQQLVRSQSGDARMVVDGECGPVTWAWLVPPGRLATEAVAGPRSIRVVGHELAVGHRQAPRQAHRLQQAPVVGDQQHRAAEAVEAGSSCSMAARSRWLVGSSSTRQLTPLRLQQRQRGAGALAG